MLNRRFGVLIAVAALSGLLFSIPSFADSHVRIVRLSYIEGEVQIDRNAGQGFERAILNLPVVEGARVRTGGDGFAEVEFEDGSTIRLTSDTEVAFHQLALRDSGVKASSVDVSRGMVYVSFLEPKDNDLTLTFGAETATFTAPSHIRLAVGKANASLAVFKGDVQVNGPSGAAEADKKETLKFDLADQDKFTLAKKVDEDPLDEWDKDQDAYRQRYARNNPVNNSPYAYGLADLNYYGNFSMLPGYGMVWAPFFADASWSPFTDGAWAWYPGIGYSWVSGYPWGWMPFHYGSWDYVPSSGWVWVPGGTWVGVNNPIRAVNAPSGFNPPRPPATTVRSFVMVNRGMSRAATMTAEGMRIRSNSAGLGIPRGSINNLGRASQHVEQHGFANRSFSNPPAAAAYNPRMDNPTMRGEGSSRPGFSPAPRSSPSSRPSSGSPGMAPPAFHPSGPSGGARSSGGPRSSGGSRR